MCGTLFVKIENDDFDNLVDYVVGVSFAADQGLSVPGSWL